VISFVTILIRFFQALWDSLKEPEFQALFSLVILTLVSGTLFYSQVEGWSLLDSLYFSVITLTTVGYGDLTPATAAGKVFTIVYLFAGIGIILGFVNAIAKRSTERRAGVFDRRRRDKAEPRSRTTEGHRDDERDQRR
jgi:voltage-gated potassium channel